MKPARLIVLGIALAAGGVAAWLARGADPAAPEQPKPLAQIESIEVLVAKQDIAIGQSVKDEIQWQVWPKSAASPQFIQRSDRPNAIEQIAGSIARTPFARGEPIREAKLIKTDGSGFMAALLPAGMRAMSTEITPETGAAGFILPNDSVDVILTRVEKRESGEVYKSETVFTNVRVLAIDQTLEEKNGQRVVVGKIATLELNSAQVEKLALARRIGSLSLALRSIVDKKESERAEESESAFERRGGVNVVRFGQPKATFAN